MFQVTLTPGLSHPHSISALTHRAIAVSSEPGFTHSGGTVVFQVTLTPGVEPPTLDLSTHSNNGD